MNINKMTVKNQRNERATVVTTTTEIITGEIHLNTQRLEQTVKEAIYLLHDIRYLLTSKGYSFQSKTNKNHFDLKYAKEGLKTYSQVYMTDLQSKFQANEPKIDKYS